MRSVRWAAVVAAVVAGGMVAVSGCGDQPPQPVKIEPPASKIDPKAEAAKKLERARHDFWKAGSSNPSIWTAKNNEFQFDLVRVGWMLDRGRQVLVGAGTIKNITDSKQLQPESVAGYFMDEFKNRHQVSATANQSLQKLNPGESDWMFFEVGRILPKAKTLTLAIEIGDAGRSIQDGRWQRVDDAGNPIEVRIDIPQFDEKTAIIAPAD